jgi:hypothetical protein
MDRNISDNDEQKSTRSEKNDSLPLGEARTESEKKKPDDERYNARDEKPPSHSLKILLKGHSMHEWIELILTAVLAFVGIAYTFYAAKQWDAMRTALDKTDIAIGQTNQALELNRQALELNRRQTEATEAGVGVARGSLRTAEQTLMSANKSFRLDQWPYLIASSFEPVEGPTVGHPLRVGVTFKNVGKSPANSVETYRILKIGSWNSNEDRIKFAEDAFTELRIQRPRDAQSVPPGQSVIAVSDPTNPITADDIGTKYFLFTGFVRYMDVFGGPQSVHVTEFCIILPLRVMASGIPNVPVNFCGVHNQMR